VGYRRAACHQITAYAVEERSLGASTRLGVIVVLRQQSRSFLGGEERLNHQTQSSCWTSLFLFWCYERLQLLVGKVSSIDQSNLFVDQERADIGRTAL
jgi:hypothetical protein